MPQSTWFSWKSCFAGMLSAVIVVLAYAAWLMHNGFSARDKPGHAEAALAAYALHASASAAQRSLVNPIAPSPAALQEAEQHFADHCAACHANNGSGHTMYGDGMNPAPPDMRLWATQSKSDGELYSIIQNGIRMSGMPAFGTPRTDDPSTWKLVLFLRHLPSLTPEEELAMRKANPISPSELKEEQDEDEFLHGTKP
jgi:mono/diheme cytochrome c family protein